MNSQNQEKEIIKMSKFVEANEKIAVIGIDANVEPVAVLLDQGAVIADLCGQRVKHGILPAGHAGIGCNPLSLLQLRQCRDNRNSSGHSVTSL